MAGGVTGIFRAIARGLGTRFVGEQLLFQGGKAELRSALANGGIKGINAGQARAILQALIEGSVDDIKIAFGENGIVTYFTRARRNGYQTLVRIYGDAGELESMAQRHGMRPANLYMARSGSES